MEVGTAVEDMVVEGTVMEGMVVTRTEVWVTGATVREDTVLGLSEP
jgi:hypothetical protein